MGLIYYCRRNDEEHLHIHHIRGDWFRWGIFGEDVLGINPTT